MRDLGRAVFKILFVLTVFFGAGLPATAEAPKPRILIIGDSLMAMNRMLDGSVAQALEDLLGEKVADHSVVGARYFYKIPILGSTGLKISTQFDDGSWDYVVMNGGGNDLLFGCGCGACARVMDRLVAADGTKGAIPQLVAKIRATGAKVIYTGYLRTPGVTSPVEGCGPLGDEMDRRLTKMATFDDGVEYLLLANLVKKDGDRSYHGMDLIHPSVKGSRAIAAEIANLMAQ
jgi:lysophospholipase L1-like esterase